MLTAHNVRRILIGFMAFAAGMPVAAQQVPDSDIIVTGQKQSKERAITEQARNVSIVGSPLDNPLARFEQRICPGVMGLKEEAASYIVDRIRYNSEQLGLRLAADDGKCEPNFIVAVVDDAQTQLTELARRQGYMLAGLSTDQRGELLDSSRAARVWVNTVTRTNTGMPVPSQRDAASTPERTISFDASGSPVRMTLPPIAAGWASHSRIYFPTREDIVSVLVIFDGAEVRGKSLLQLADYATMRGLALTRETRGELAAATILSLFDSVAHEPERLTSFDLAYLTSLYDGIANMPATSKLAGVSRRLSDEIATSGSDGGTEAP